MASDARLTAAGISRLADGMARQLESSTIPPDFKARGRQVIEDAYRASIHLNKWACAVVNEWGQG